MSSVELLAAMLLTLVVIGAAAALAAPHSLAARLQPDVVDAQQRLRTAADVLVRALYMAGSGVDAGTVAGPLGWYLPPVIPRRVGRAYSDSTLVPRQDALTVLHVPASISQTALAAPLVTSTALLLAMPSCPFGQPACGFGQDDGLVIFDEEGHFSVFTVTASAGANADLRPRARLPIHPFASGSHVAETDMRVYYFDAAQRQLRMGDGDLTDQPVVDGIADLTVEYFGTPGPPRSPRPPLGVGNCLFDAAGAPNPALGTWASGPDGLAPLPLARLGDGPWCGAGDTVFDADLLRVRRVRITLTADAGRGARNPSVVVDVSPRTLAELP